MYWSINLKTSIILFRNDLLCPDIETIVFPYAFHGERKQIFDEVIERLEMEHTYGFVGLYVYLIVNKNLSNYDKFLLTIDVYASIIRLSVTVKILSSYEWSIRAA